VALPDGTRGVVVPEWSSDMCDEKPLAQRFAAEVIRNQYYHLDRLIQMMERQVKTVEHTITGGVSRLLDADGVELARVTIETRLSDGESRVTSTVTEAGDQAMAAHRERAMAALKSMMDMVGGPEGLDD
jgi:hypothetical protein